jgi:hypothetical protein
LIDVELVTNLLVSFTTMGNDESSEVAKCSIYGNNNSNNKNDWYFDGKNLYPVVAETFGKCNSIKRKKGTALLISISMGNEVYSEFV